jgi:hypothetical protein
MTQKQYTLIRVTGETAEKLKDVGKKSETYDDIINRLLELLSKNE